MASESMRLLAAKNYVWLCARREFSTKRTRFMGRPYAERYDAARVAFSRALDNYAQTYAEEQAKGRAA